MNDIISLLSDKTLKPKEKTEILSKLLLDKKIKIDELIAIAKESKDSPKATCIEALEFATKVKPEIADKNCLDFVTQSLCEKAPRIKWESAKVIGNIAHLFPKDMDKAVKNLLDNSEHEGTVVRWSAAFALGEIIMKNPLLAKKLVPAAEAIIKREEKNSIRKIYAHAVKKAGK